MRCWISLSSRGVVSVNSQHGTVDFGVVDQCQPLFLPGFASRVAGVPPYAIVVLGAARKGTFVQALGRILSKTQSGGARRSQSAIRDGTLSLPTHTSACRTEPGLLETAQPSTGNHDAESTTQNRMTIHPESSSPADTADDQWLTPKDICSRLQIPEQTFYHWRVKHLGLAPTASAGTCGSAGRISTLGWNRGWKPGCHHDLRCRWGHGGAVRKCQAANGAPPPDTGTTTA